MKKFIVLITLMLSLSACQHEGLIPETSALTLEEAKEVALAHGFINEKEAEFIAEEFIETENYYFFIIKKDDDNFIYKIDSNNGKILLSSNQETEESLVHHQKDIQKEVAAQEEVKEVESKENTSSTKPSTSQKDTPTASAPKKEAPKVSTPKKETPKASAPKKETAALKNISKDKAIELALNNAGFSKNDVWGLKVKEKVAKNRNVYEVEFHAGQYEYEYKYAIADGQLVKKEIEFEGTPGSSSPISIAGAKEKALTRVKGANNNHIRIKEDTEDGRVVYEGKIIYGDYEYEFEIDALSGIFLEWEQEILY